VASAADNRRTHSQCESHWSDIRPTAYHPERLDQCLNDSLGSDEAYANWPRPGWGCTPRHRRFHYQQAAHYDTASTQAKGVFAARWNPVATGSALPTVTPSQIMTAGGAPRARAGRGIARSGLVLAAGLSVALAAVLAQPAAVSASNPLASLPPGTSAYSQVDGRSLRPPPLAPPSGYHSLRPPQRCRPLRSTPPPTTADPTTTLSPTTSAPPAAESIPAYVEGRQGQTTVAVFER